MPRTAEKVEDFRALLPKGTRVYIAHIEGTPIEDMVATAKRIAGEGFDVMPHFPARIIKDKATLADWIARYKGEAGVKQALLLGGGVNTPAGDFDSSMQLIETGAFDGFDRLHVAGHPEGNKDIDKDGGDAIVMQALKWKQAFSERSDAKMAIATQFCFEADPVIAWADRLAAAGVNLPIHIGVAGPAKLQTLIKFAISCGVGASLARAAKARDGRDQAAAALRADRVRRRPCRAQGQNPGLWHRTGALLPAGRHQDQCHLGHRKRRRLGRSRKRLRERFKNDPYRH